MFLKSNITNFKKYTNVFWTIELFKSITSINATSKTKTKWKCFAYARLIKLIFVFESIIACVVDNDFFKWILIDMFFITINLRSRCLILFCRRRHARFEIDWKKQSLTLKFEKLSLKLTLSEIVIFFCNMIWLKIIKFINFLKKKSSQKYVFRIFYFCIFRWSNFFYRILYIILFFWFFCISKRFIVTIFHWSFERFYCRFCFCYYSCFFFRIFFFFFFIFFFLKKIF